MTPFMHNRGRALRGRIKAGRHRLTARGAVLSVGALLWLAAPCLACAGEPEMVKDLGPAEGEWQFDYVGQFGDLDRPGEGRRHTGQSFYGLGDAVAVGGETLLEYRPRRATGNARMFFEYDSVVAIVRFRRPVGDDLGAGVWLQAGLDEDGEMARIEARGIVEKRGPVWWVQGNLAARRVNEGRAEGTHLVYAAQVSRAVGRGLWLGLETSGQTLDVSGFNRDRLNKGQYLGPRLLSEFSLGGRARGRLGLNYLRRLDSGSLRNTVQLTGGIRF